MGKIKISGIPKIRFAHSYSAPNYENVIFKEKHLIEISYIVKGSLTLRSSAGEEKANKGDVLCFLHNEPVYVESQVPHEHHTICFSLDFENLKNDINDFPLVTKASTTTKKIEKLIDDIIRTYSLEPNRDLLISSFVFQALDLINTCANKKRLEYSYSNARYTEKAKQYIYANIHREIRQKEVADYLGVSTQYLCTIFKKIEGISVISFINRMKLEKIKSLMNKENLKLYEASELFGYADPNYVSKLYKQIFHVNITQK